MILVYLLGLDVSVCETLARFLGILARNAASLV